METYVSSDMDALQGSAVLRMDSLTYPISRVKNRSYDRGTAIEIHAGSLDRFHYYWGNQKSLYQNLFKPKVFLHKG